MPFGTKALGIRKDLCCMINRHALQQCFSVVFFRAELIGLVITRDWLMNYSA